MDEAASDIARLYGTSQTVASADIEYCFVRPVTSEARIVGKNDWLVKLRDGREIDPTIASVVGSSLGTRSVFPNRCVWGFVTFIVPRDIPITLLVYEDGSSVDRTQLRLVWQVA